MKNKTVQWMTSIVAVVLLSGQVFARSDISGLVPYHFKAEKPIPSVDLKLIGDMGNVIATTKTDLNGTNTFPGVPFGTYTLKAFTATTTGLALGVTTNPPTMGGSSAGDVNGTFVPSTRHHELQLLATNPPTMGGSSAGDVNGTFVPSTRFNEPQLLVTNPPTMGGSSAGDVNGTFVPSTRYNQSQLLATNPPTMGGSSAGDVNGTFVPSTRYQDAVLLT